MTTSVKVHSKARERMREFMGDIYAEIRAAKAAGEPIGYSTSNFAKELFDVFDLKSGGSGLFRRPVFVCAHQHRLRRAR